ncbi:DUF3696 domain-containing protein [Blautia schinkii]|nr:DUF3696 domain-containing protein [Blautia schinkii]
MLKELTLQNFKCFDKIKLDFSALNVLTGLNGMGKSTVMQGILLLGQSQHSIMSEQALSLKGKFVNLGVGQDILFEKAEKDEIGISIGTENTTEQYLFGYQPEADVLPLKSRVGNIDKSGDSAWENHLYYLSAYRIEPQFLYHIENEKEVSERYFAKNGEFSIQYLKLHGGDDVANRSVLLGSKKTIADQVKAWMDLISPGVSPVITVNTSSRTAELKYEYIEGRDKTNSYKSVNVGFGITYVLPVVIALTSAKPGDIILLENPEAHIHPKGQRMLGELLAAVGAGGVQVILETHSDHVMNGIRVAVKKRRLDPENTRFFYFYKDTNDSYRHKVVCPTLDENGRLDKWPEGFFDEWDNALLELL